MADPRHLDRAAAAGSEAERMAPKMLSAKTAASRWSDPATQ